MERQSTNPAIGVTIPKTTKISSDYDVSSPLFLQHSDNPGAILVSQPLNEENYSTWHHAINMILEAKNKLGSIDGQCVLSFQRTFRLSPMEMLQ